MHTGGPPESFSKQSSLDPAPGLTWSKICIMVFYYVLDQLGSTLILYVCQNNIIFYI
jgi:hypothetical protein